MDDGQVCHREHTEARGDSSVSKVLAVQHEDLSLTLSLCVKSVFESLYPSAGEAEMERSLGLVRDLARVVSSRFSERPCHEL